jgi:hypothetical protein
MAQHGAGLGRPRSAEACAGGGGSGWAGPVSCMHPSDLDPTACDDIFLDDPKTGGARDADDGEGTEAHREGYRGRRRL